MYHRVTEKQVFLLLSFIRINNICAENGLLVRVCNLCSMKLKSEEEVRVNVFTCDLGSTVCYLLWVWWWSSFILMKNRNQFMNCDPAITWTCSLSLPQYVCSSLHLQIILCSITTIRKCAYSWYTPFVHFSLYEQAIYIHYNMCVKRKHSNFTNTYETHHTVIWYPFWGTITLNPTPQLHNI